MPAQQLWFMPDVFRTPGRRVYGVWLLAIYLVVGLYIMLLSGGNAVWEEVCQDDQVKSNKVGVLRCGVKNESMKMHVAKILVQKTS